jgi:hypothetical protein
MTTPLSPAAQAVLDAFLKDADEDATLRLFQGHLADALRAAADQVVPVEDEVMRHSIPDAYDQRQATRRHFLSLATELDPTP